MIRHLALFKLNESVERDDPRVAAGEEAFRSLEAKIPQIQHWELGWNLSDRPTAYDFALNAGFADAAAKHTYAQHPQLQAAITLWREFTTWVTIDYEY